MNIRHQLPLARLRVCGAIASLALLSGCLSGTDSADDGNQQPAPSVNNPPTISGTPPTNVTINEAFSFTPTASDPDGDALTFSISNQPTWAEFDQTTGRLWGTPTLGDIGIEQDVRISVSDGRASASLSAFDLTVSQQPGPSNSPPTISGNPPSAVTVNEAYSFTPTASDPDGDTLTFSIVNQPAWADFDPTTGRLWGTPAMGDIGIAQNVRISVSDGSVSAALSAFDVEVMQAALGSATLTWTAPTLNTDGTTVTDLAGFRIYYGTTLNQWTNQIDIDNPSITTYVVENLSPDTYYFVATAINSSGAESGYSNATSRTIQ
ncbi:MAG: putative Ig domain-containing protein [Woeseiaceae bacterium]|nr:putative Ig domain-containing protein [Woeseiaceae bacterium]